MDETRLLQDLLDPARYDKRAIPKYNRTSNVTVKIGLTALNLLELVSTQEIKYRSFNKIVHLMTSSSWWHFNFTVTWWRYQMETFSALLAPCAGNSLVTGEFPAQKPVMRSFDVFFDLSLNKRLNKQSWGWWFETPSCSLWRHCNEMTTWCSQSQNDYHCVALILYFRTNNWATWRSCIGLTRWVIGMPYYTLYEQ